MARLAPQDTRPARTPVAVLKPDPRLWRTALRLAQGDASRVEVVTPSEALVHNAPPGAASAARSRRSALRPAKP